MLVRQLADGVVRQLAERAEKFASGDRVLKDAAEADYPQARLMIKLRWLQTVQTRSLWRFLNNFSNFNLFNLCRIVII